MVMRRHVVGTPNIPSPLLLPLSKGPYYIISIILKKENNKLLILNTCIMIFLLPLSTNQKMVKSRVAFFLFSPIVRHHIHEKKNCKENIEKGTLLFFQNNKKVNNS